MKCAAHQPNFIPWLGFFDKASKVDTFTLLDEVSFSKNSFTNRNRIRTKKGPLWITIPVKRSPHTTKIREVKIDNEQKWQERIKKTFETNYARASFWRAYEQKILELLNMDSQLLIDYNMAFLRWLFEELKLECKTVMQSELNIGNKKNNELLIEICKQTGCDTYYSGQGSKNYINQDMFEKANILIEWHNFTHPIYKQVYDPFICNLSILDALLNLGFHLVASTFWQGRSET